MTFSQFSSTKALLLVRNIAEAQAIFGDDFNFDDVNVDELEGDMGNEDVDDDDDDDDEDDDEIIDDGEANEPQLDEDGNVIEDVRKRDRQDEPSLISICRKRLR